MLALQFSKFFLPDTKIIELVEIIILNLLPPQSSAVAIPAFVLNACRIYLDLTPKLTWNLLSLLCA
jgi:hypothetical protein